MKKLFIVASLFVVSCANKNEEVKHAKHVSDSMAVALAKQINCPLDSLFRLGVDTNAAK